MKMIRNLAFAFGIVAAIVLALLPPKKVEAGTSAQVTHAYLCGPENTVGGQQRRISVPTTGGGTYTLNGQGCAIVVGADIGYFLSQGFTYGQGVFTLRQEGITATQTTSNLNLPQYGYILGIILSETAGNAISGGVDIGNTNTPTNYASAVTLGANATVGVADSAFTRVNVPSGAPLADQILVKCHTSCNSGSINITILYTYF